MMPGAGKILLLNFPIAQAACQRAKTVQHQETHDAYTEHNCAYNAPVSPNILPKPLKFTSHYALL